MLRLIYSVSASPYPVLRSQADAEKLYHQVAASFKLTKQICTCKIQFLAKYAQLHKQVKKKKGQCQKT